VTFTPPVVVPTLGSPKPSHPQIAVDAKGRIMIAWDEVVDGVRRASARELRRTGTDREFGPVVPLDAKEPAMYPVLAATAQDWIAVWTTGGSVPVVRARILSD
jgi:hypothetical protein